MDAYQKLENPTFHQSHSAINALEREQGLDKCHSISAYRIWYKRNHPDKTKKGKDAEYKPVTFDQADCMAEDSFGDWGQWLLSESGFLIVTDGDGNPISPGLQGLYTFSRWCGHRRNVWRSIKSTPKINSKPLAKSTLANREKVLREEYACHMSTYAADRHGMPVAKLSQSFIGEGQQDNYETQPQAQSRYYTAPRKQVKHARQSRWSAVRNRILEGSKPTAFSLEDEMRKAELNRSLSMA